MFLDKIMFAKANNVNYIETSEDIFRHYKQDPTKYFWFQNVRVYKNGMREQIEKEESIQMGQRLHGMSEGVVEGR